MTRALLRVVTVAVGVGLVGAAWAQGVNPWAVGDRAPAAAKEPPPADVRDLKWDDLLPKDWNPRRLLIELGVGKLKDNDPRADEIRAKIREEYDRAPVVKELDGVRARLGGFVVMLEGTPKGITEFLLVPYYGACIHVPPPPANQIVHVFPREPVPESLANQAVWVTGTVTTTQAYTKHGAVGYRFNAAEVEKYRR
jgi:hypothetical protein